MYPPPPPPPPPPLLQHTDAPLPGTLPSTLSPSCRAEGDRSQQDVLAFATAAEALLRHLAPYTQGSDQHPHVFTVQAAPMTINLALRNRLRPGLLPLLQAYVSKATACLRWGAKVLNAELEVRLHLGDGRFEGACHLPAMLRAAASAFLPQSLAAVQRLATSGGNVDHGLVLIASCGGPAPAPTLSQPTATCPACGTSGLPANSLAKFQAHQATCRGKWATQQDGCHVLPAAAYEGVLVSIVKHAASGLLRSGLVSARADLLTRLQGYLAFEFGLDSESVLELLAAKYVPTLGDFEGLDPVLRGRLSGTDGGGWTLRSLLRTWVSAGRPYIGSGSRLRVGHVNGLDERTLVSVLLATFELRAHIATVYALRVACGQVPTYADCPLVMEMDWADFTLRIQRAVVRRLVVQARAYELWAATNRGGDEVWRGCVLAARAAVALEGLVEEKGDGEEEEEDGDAAGEGEEEGTHNGIDFAALLNCGDADVKRLLLKQGRIVSLSVDLTEVHLTFHRPQLVPVENATAEDPDVEGVVAEESMEVETQSDDGGGPGAGAGAGTGSRAGDGPGTGPGPGGRGPTPARNPDPGPGAGSGAGVGAGTGAGSRVGRDGPGPAPDPAPDPDPGPGAGAGAGAGAGSSIDSAKAWCDRVLEAVWASLEPGRRSMKQAPPPPSVRHFESPLLSRSKPAFDNLICGLYHSSVALGFRGRASGWDLGILLIMASVTRMLAIKV